ncbi:MAG TPA: non-homologous end-joining DNA ligase [Acidimicrobiales bacterium]|nr:non-homologous end-joining DNA ligase [Acidimicrobiales bacterium]
MPEERSEHAVEVDGRRLKVSNLAKVLYPEAGFTKAEVIDYYVRVAPAMLPHIADRGVTLRRYPNGVDEQSFFEKRCPSHRPEWIGTFAGPGDRNGTIGYCALDSVAALAWSANMAALEIHAPMARGVDIESPTMCVFDLDPGAPADIRQCAEVALDIRDVLQDLAGLSSLTKTSGSKGLQVYVPLNRPHSHDDCSSFAQAVAQVLERHHGERVTSVMRKSLRPGKVFIDWSQNSRHKTTVAVYSLRARPRPTVSTPVTWDEVDEAASGAPLGFEAADVLRRVEDHGDLFAEALTVEQDLPARGSG